MLRSEKPHSIFYSMFLKIRGVKSVFANVYLYSWALEGLKKEVAVGDRVHVIGVSVCVLDLLTLQQY